MQRICHDTVLCAWFAHSNWAEGMWLVKHCRMTPICAENDTSGVAYPLQYQFSAWARQQSFHVIIQRKPTSGLNNVLFHTPKIQCALIITISNSIQQTCILHRSHSSTNILPCSSANRLRGKPERRCNPSTFWLMRYLMKPNQNEVVTNLQQAINNWRLITQLRRSSSILESTRGHLFIHFKLH
jgi:hypothetical protein